MKRIKIIDGFRAIAVLGVLWAHIWKFAGVPSYRIFQVDLAGVLSFFGTGVDLFFVISGFCMYLMHVSRQKDLSFNNYLSYLKKRWLRIAPAFYIAVILYGLFAVQFKLHYFDVTYALKQIFFIRNVFKDITQYAPHFWSLCTEWHFYMVLPLILFGMYKLSFYRCIFIVATACLLFRFIAWMPDNDSYNLIDYSIANRLIEFLAGIVTAKLYLDKQRGWLFNSIAGLILGMLIAFAGRMLMSSGMQERPDVVGMLARTLNLPLLTAGFGLVIVNTLQKRSFFSRILETRLFTSIGKYSYSMYLWHWIISLALTRYMMEEWKFQSFMHVNILFCLSLLLLYPVSMASYYLFESFYFRRRKRMIANVKAV